MLDKIKKYYTIIPRSYAELRSASMLQSRRLREERAATQELNMAKKKQSPGTALTEMLKKFDLNYNRLAKAIGISSAMVRLIARDENPISAPVAFRLAKFFKTSPEYWLALQSDFDIAKTGEDKKLAKALAAIQTADKVTFTRKKRAKNTAKTAKGKKPAAKKTAKAKAAKKAGPAKAGKKAGRGRPAVKKTAAKGAKPAAKKPAAKKAAVKKTTAKKPAVTPAETAVNEPQI
jgi:addiction module HigA family antidote